MTCRYAGHFPNLPPTPAPVGATARVPVRAIYDVECSPRHDVRRPSVQVGARINDYVILEILERDASRNERVRARCVCGEERVFYLYTLRRAGRCKHGARDGRRTNGPWKRTG